MRGAWEPPASAIESLKAGLQRFVGLNTGQRRLRPWAEYSFQYQGQVHGNRRYVLVNALCRIDPDWPLHAQIVLRMEGAPCFFHVKYDAVEGIFYDLFM